MTAGSDEKPAPVQFHKPGLSYVQSAIAGGFSGHTVSLLATLIRQIAAGGQMNFNDVVVMALVSIGSYLIALIPISVMAMIGAPLAFAIHAVFRRSGIDYRYLAPSAGAVIALISVTLFFGLSDGFANRYAQADAISMISSLVGGGVAGSLFWRLAVRPLAGRR